MFEAVSSGFMNHRINFYQKKKNEPPDKSGLTH